MAKRKTISGLVALAGAGLAGLMALTSAGCINQGSYAKDKAIYSASCFEINQEKPEKPNYWVSKDLNNDGIDDCAVVQGKGRVFSLRVAPRHDISILFAYQDDKSFEIRNSSRFAYQDDKSFEIRNSFRYGRTEEENAIVDRLYPLLNEGIKGCDVLDSSGKLIHRVFKWPEESGLENLERIEDFDEQGKMTRAAITDKKTLQEVYLLQWNEKTKDYDVRVNELESQGLIEKFKKWPPNPKQPTSTNMLPSSGMLGPF